MAASLSSSSGEQQYSLRWNDFHSSILSTFRHLKDEEDFVDVTLACDRDSFTAHKVVLSACSPYFRQLLKANPCQHPIVILRDVASSEMESLLRFMYHGEVHVGQEQLAAFLKTAQMLQVRGLADVNSNSASTTTTTKTPITTNRSNGSAPATPRCGTWQDTSSRLEMLNENGSSPPPEKRSRSYSPPIEASRLLANHVSTGKTEHLQESLLGQALEGGPTIHTSSSNNVHSQIEDSNSMSENDDDNTNHDSLINSVKTEPNDLLNDSLEHHRNSFPAALLGLQGLMPGPSGIHAATNQDPNYAARRGLDMMRVRATDPRPCPKCGKIYRSAHTLRTHLEDKHTVCPGYRCVLCGTVAKSRNSLHSHMSRQHRGISTKDLPVLPMPSPFDPEMASRLLAKAGVKVSAQELRARASPTQGGPRRSDSRLELSRAAPSDAGSSDPEDLSTPLSLSRYEPSPNNNTVIRAVAAKSNLDSNQQHGTREPHIAPFQQHQQLQQLQHLHHQQQQPHGASATGSAIVDTFLQFIAENSGLNTEQAVAYAAQAKLAQISALDKFAARQGPPRDYPIIGRDPNTEDRHPPPNIHDSSNLAGDSSADEDDEDEDDDVHDADNEDVRSEPETLKAE